MILLRSGLNYSIFELELFAYLMKQFIYSSLLHYGFWNLFQKESNKAGASSFPGSLQLMSDPETTLSQSSWSFGHHLSGDVSYRKQKTGGGMFHYLIILLGGPRESF